MTAADAAIKSDPERSYQFSRFRPPDPYNGERRPGCNGTADSQNQVQQKNLTIAALVRHAQRIAAGAV